MSAPLANFYLKRVLKPAASKASFHQEAPLTMLTTWPGTTIKIIYYRFYSFTYLCLVSLLNDVFLCILREDLLEWDLRSHKSHSSITSSWIKLSWSITIIWKLYKRMSCSNRKTGETDLNQLPVTFPLKVKKASSSEFKGKFFDFELSNVEVFINLKRPLFSLIKP